MIKKSGQMESIRDRMMDIYRKRHHQSAVFLQSYLISCGFNPHKFNLKSLAKHLAA